MRKHQNGRLADVIVVSRTGVNNCRPRQTTFISFIYLCNDIGYAEFHFQLIAIVILMGFVGPDEDLLDCFIVQNVHLSVDPAELGGY